MSVSKEPRRRAPAGVDHRQIAMRLLPAEREQLDSLARDYGITHGALSREIYLAGLPVWLERVCHPSTRYVSPAEGAAVA